MSSPTDTATTPLARLIESSNPSIVGTKHRKSSAVNKLQSTDSIMLDASSGSLSNGSQVYDMFVQQKGLAPANISYTGTLMDSKRFQVPLLISQINEPPFTSGVTSFISASGKTFDTKIFNVSPETSLFGDLSIFKGTWRVEVTQFPNHSLLNEYWKGKDKVTMLVIWKGNLLDLDLVNGFTFCGFEENDNGQLCPYQITLKAAFFRDIDKEYQQQPCNPAVPITQLQVAAPSQHQVRNFNQTRGGDARPPSLPTTN
ncbi:hypothetical protein O181_039796 [Austropuccinia psidii MF-1]|uniref:Uncharacterized protein n=1 Tax=Austropuccinia psidii MF-1 TaxID=1389203 RepID=A0A9Q3HCU1_9BASI|nr:hypothetical protein [Austropuccinia psidii MF-1]